MKATDRPASRRLFKPAPPHNFMCDGAPARCMCVACCAEMVARRCTATHPTTGTQCGDYAKHRGEHSMIPATIFCIAEERIRLDGDQIAEPAPDATSLRARSSADTPDQGAGSALSTTAQVRQ